MPILRRSLLLSCATLLLTGCGSGTPRPNPRIEASTQRSTPFATVAPGPSELPPEQRVAAPRLVDRHAELGLDFTYDNGASGKALMVESTGGGGGWIDYDRDGWPDLYLIQGGDPLAETPHSAGDRVIRNIEGRQFVDVTDDARPPDHGYGQGLAVGDFDNDGFEDLLITNVGADVLWKNQGDGTFRDITDATGTGDPRWGASAAWFDLDLDGDLDLFVCNYLHYDVRNPVPCRSSDGKPAICHPESVPPETSECYENLGDGSFRKVAREWGLLAPNGKSLGVAIADFNGDGLPDIFVSNDTAANHLFAGTQLRRFTESAVVLGCAYNALGQYQANMGIACNDYDRNGYLDLYVTTFTDDSNTLFANLGPAGFRDVTRTEGLHAPTIETLGFGTVMLDLNADGHLDLLNANGHIDDWRDKGDRWKMRPELLSYVGPNWTLHSPATAGEFFDQEHLGRAVSTADFDCDGDVDLLIVFQDRPAALLVNESDRGNWLQIECSGRRSNRRGIGARVTVVQGENTWTLQLTGGTSYCAAHEPLLSVGLGQSAEQCTVTVEWPGSTQPSIRSSVAASQRIQIREE